MLYHELICLSTDQQKTHIVAMMSLCKQQSARLSHSLARGHSTVAVLYQALEPPVINGARKPRKPGGRVAFPLTVHFHCETEIDTLLQAIKTQAQTLLIRFVSTVSASSPPRHLRILQYRKAGASPTPKKASSLPYSKVLHTSGPIRSCSPRIHCRCRNH